MFNSVLSKLIFVQGTKYEYTFLAYIYYYRFSLDLILYVEFCIDFIIEMLTVTEHRTGNVYNGTQARPLSRFPEVVAV